MACDSSQPNSYEEAYEDNRDEYAETSSPEENPAGIVSHRNQFNNPEAPDTGPDERLFARSGPISGAEVISELFSGPPLPSWNRIKSPVPGERYGTLFFDRFHKITSGLHGGVEISGVDVFGREVKILAHEIRPTFVEEVRVSEISEISLSMLLKDLFNFRADRFKIDPEQYDLKAWYQFLNENVLPVAEELTDAWLGPKGRNIPNPIAGLFHGPKGILSGMLHPEVVLEKVHKLQGNMIVPIRRVYVGRATVVAYETDQARLL